MIQDNFLNQFVLENTFNKNILDLIISNDPSRIFCVNVGPPLGSTIKNNLHATLTWDYMVNGGNFLSTYTIPKYDFARGDFKSLEIISSFNWTEILNSDIDVAYNKIMKVYKEAFMRFIPVIKSDVKVKPA
ncbi:unnamed protein product [Brachionus calyciflorus]|uniref:Uncharacterized protein n=1 Tax=Brachionus calyciflorus TaxID=104777 RepID=A0A813MGW9_9BILA|nr:unnamed protein product [Brachionus calyciflorus]